MFVVMIYVLVDRPDQFFDVPEYAPLETVLRQIPEEALDDVFRATRRWWA
jgi:hypothetical protein